MSPLSTKASRIAGLISRQYQLVLIPIVMGFMFVVRVRTVNRFLAGNRVPNFAGVDSWYQWRTTMFSVRNWPGTMTYDVWTGFPTGNYIGHFGTVFDQIIATIALILGAGSPSQNTVFLVTLVGVPVLAALVAVPTYFIGREVGGRIGGVTGIVLLGLFPGTFLDHTTAGMYEHHVIEVLFMATSILTLLLSFKVAEMDHPRFRQLSSSEFDQILRPIAYSVTAGLSICLYLLSWPPGTIFLAILGITFTTIFCLKVVRGVSPEYIGFVAIVALSVVGGITLVSLETLQFRPTARGPLHPIAAIVVAGGCAAMIGLAHKWRSHGFDQRYYPLTVLMAVILVGLAGILLFPEIATDLISKVSGRIIPIGYSTGALTIAEVTPPANIWKHFYSEYGLAVGTAMLGLSVMLIRLVQDKNPSAGHALIIIWTLVLTSMAITQTRFNYYYVLPVAVLNAYLIGVLFNWFQRVQYRRTPTNDWIPHLLISLLIIFLIAPLTPFIGENSVVNEPHAIRPNPTAEKWQETNKFLRENTPDVGNWGGAGNHDELSYYGKYRFPDGDFDYPTGAYGVLTWWDYGHLITVKGERIPHSNPFQQHAVSSAQYLLASTEQNATLVLQAIEEGESVTDQANRIPSNRNDTNASRERVSYVIVDDSMAAGKFPGITKWTDHDWDSYHSDQTVQGDAGAMEVKALNDAYYNTQLARLYYDDADGLRQYRLVHESSDEAVVGSVAHRVDGEWETVWLNRDLTRLEPDVVLAIQLSANHTFFGVHRPSTVKTFERVEGATITGATTLDENATVLVKLPLRARTTNRSFIYSRSTTVTEDGAFSVTVPYATSNDLGPHAGYTNSTVIATDSYEIIFKNTTLPNRSVSVPELAIYTGGKINATKPQNDP